MPAEASSASRRASEWLMRPLNCHSFSSFSAFSRYNSCLNFSGFVCSSWDFPSYRINYSFVMSVFRSLFPYTRFSLAWVVSGYVHTGTFLSSTCGALDFRIHSSRSSRISLLSSRCMTCTAPFLASGGPMLSSTAPLSRIGAIVETAYSRAVQTLSTVWGTLQRRIWLADGAAVKARGRFSTSGRASMGSCL